MAYSRNNGAMLFVDVALVRFPLMTAGLWDLAYGDRGAWKSVGAEGFIERASNISPSVNTSAANLYKISQ